jgi:hypothetical protein
MIVFKLCQQVPWELKNQIKTTQNCLSSLKFSQISSGQNKNRSKKKSSQDLICPPNNKKNAFFKQNDVRKIILESKPTTRGGWCLEKKEN